MFFLILSIFLNLEIDASVLVYKIKGNAEFININGEFLLLKEGDRVDESITIKTSSSSEVELVYDDGIMVFLSENSTFTIKGKGDNVISSWILNLITLSLYAQEKKEESWIDYLYGKALFFIKKLDKTYAVKTPHAVIGVRGTTFSIISKDDISEVGLFRGVVDIEKDEKKFILKAGQSAIITTHQVKIENRLSALMQKEKKRAEKLERYFENVMIKLKKRDEDLRKKIDRLKERLKQ